MTEQIPQEWITTGAQALLDMRQRLNGSDIFLETQQRHLDAATTDAEAVLRAVLPLIEAQYEQVGVMWEDDRGTLHEREAACEGKCKRVPVFRRLSEQVVKP